MSETLLPVRCGHCGRLTDPGNFCQRCGTPLAETPAQTSSSTVNTVLTGKLELDGENDASPAILADEVEVSGNETVKPDTLRVRPVNIVEPEPLQVVAPVVPRITPIGVQQTSHDATWHANPDCPLEVTYNFARVFMVGHMYPFQFKIRALQDNITRVVIGFRCNGGKQFLPEDHEVDINLSQTVAKQWLVNFEPTGETAGEIAIQIYIGYQKGEQSECQWLTAQVSHRIYPAHMPTQELAQKIVINIQENVSVNGHANDVSVRNVVDDVNRIAEQINTTGDTSALIDKLSSLKLEKPLRLEPSSHPYPPFKLRLKEPPAEARVPALTIVSNNQRLHLFCQKIVRFGRNRDSNDLVLRVMGKDKHIDKDASILISKNHGYFEYRGNDCVLRDISTYGIAIDGQKLVKGQDFIFDASTSYRMSLATTLECKGKSSYWQMTTYSCMRLTQMDCPRDNNCPATSPSSLYIQRTDGLNESYLIVWRCSPLERVLPAFVGASIYSINGAFQLHRPGYLPQWLKPGDEIKIAGRLFSVTAFEQVKF